MIEGQGDIRRIAWRTGAAQSYFQQAIDSGADAFVTGEISEPMVHLRGSRAFIISPRAITQLNVLE